VDLGIADCLARKLNFTAKIAGDREEEDSTFVSEEAVYVERGEGGMQ